MGGKGCGCGCEWKGGAYSHVKRSKKEAKMSREGSEMMDI